MLYVDPQHSATLPSSTLTASDPVRPDQDLLVTSLAVSNGVLGDPAASTDPEPAVPSSVTSIPPPLPVPMTRAAPLALHSFESLAAKPRLFARDAFMAAHPVIAEIVSTTTDRSSVTAVLASALGVALCKRLGHATVLIFNSPHLSLAKDFPPSHPKLFFDGLQRYSLYLGWGNVCVCAGYLSDALLKRGEGLRTVVLFVGASKVRVGAFCLDSTLVQDVSGSLSACEVPVYEPELTGPDDALREEACGNYCIDALGKRSHVLELLDRRYEMMCRADVGPDDAMISASI